MIIIGCTLFAHKKAFKEKTRSKKTLEDRPGKTKDGKRSRPVQTGTANQATCFKESYGNLNLLKIRQTTKSDTYLFCMNKKISCKKTE